MSHGLKLHDGTGIIAEDPSLGILISYGSTVPADASVGYSPGCRFTKTNGTTGATVSYVNVGTKASSTFQVQSTGLSSSPTGAGIGYATGAGGAVTQITSRSTGVTINKLSGTITTDTTSLAAEASAVFTVTNSTVAIGDVVVLAQQSGKVALNTQVEVTAVSNGSFNITVVNNNVAAGTAETGAIIINFVVIKAVSA